MQGIGELPPTGETGVLERKARPSLSLPTPHGNELCAPEGRGLSVTYHEITKGEVWV